MSDSINSFAGVAAIDEISAAIAKGNSPKANAGRCQGLIFDNLIEKQFNGTFSYYSNLTINTPSK